MATAGPITVDDQTFSVSPIYQDGFARLRPIWIIEGQAKVEAAGGKLCVDATGEGDARYSTLWLNRKLRGDVLIEYTAYCPAQESPAANLNQFLMAHEAHGADVVSTKHSGAYKEYHALPLYIITFTEKWSRLRRCPGFECVSERMDRCSVNDKKYRIKILKTGDRIRFFVNGDKYHDWTDPEGSHTSGKFGFRTWNTRVEWDSLRIWQVEGEET